MKEILNISLNTLLKLKMPAYERKYSENERQDTEWETFIKIKILNKELLLNRQRTLKTP